MSLGAMMSLPERDDYHQRRNKLLGSVAVAYGGRIAEEVVFGDVSAGASNDIERATDLARNMVTKWGLSERLGPLTYSEDDGEVFLGHLLKVVDVVDEDVVHVAHPRVYVTWDRDVDDEQRSRGAPGRSGVGDQRLGQQGLARTGAGDDDIGGTQCLYLLLILDSTTNNICFHRRGIQLPHASGGTFKTYRFELFIKSKSR